MVKMENGEFEAEITGNLRYTANSREDFPAVGDWVGLSESGTIHHLFARNTAFQRLNPRGKVQVIAANDPDEALDILRRQRVSVLLTDLMMPNTSGMDLLRRAGAI